MGSWAGQLAGRGRARWQEGSAAVNWVGSWLSRAATLEGGGRGPTPEPGEGPFPSRSRFLAPPLVFIEAKQVRESSLPRGPPLRTGAQTPAAPHPTPASS